MLVHGCHILLLLPGAARGAQRRCAHDRPPDAAPHLPAGSSAVRTHLVLVPRRAALHSSQAIAATARAAQAPAQLLRFCVHRVPKLSLDPLARRKRPRAHETCVEPTLTLAASFAILHLSQRVRSSYTGPLLPLLSADFLRAHLHAVLVTARFLRHIGLALAWRLLSLPNQLLWPTASPAPQFPRPHRFVWPTASSAPPRFCQGVLRL